MSTFNVSTFDVKKFDEILSRGLSDGLGNRNGQMCIEAAICTVLDLLHGDDPQCVAKSVRSFKISLNNKKWSSAEARAKGLRDLGLAQLGSLGVVDDKIFVKRLAEEIIGQILPKLFRKLYPKNVKFMELVDICEKEKSRKSAVNLKNAAAAAAYAAAAAKEKDSYLILAAKIALDILKEMGSPGCQLLEK